ncbi:MAG: DUF262 domain-containing protein [Candidatus Nanopelagicales bacterium]|nr:DUF262 domain-containing protein [Candidatus Nanopelagicales bacterium]
MNMAIEVGKWPLSQFRSLADDKTLDLSPPNQRRQVWTETSRMFLIDSIARRVPIGAITLYVDESKGYKVWEVIDGKQRLTTFLEFLGDAFAVDQEVITKTEHDDLSNVGLELASPIYGHLFTELETAVSKRLLQYEVPVFEVTGERAQAVQAFTRMNRNSYVLEPQEIRNAVYANSRFLHESMSVCSAFASSVGGESGFVTMGVVSAEKFTRMQDVQFASELLALALQGEQHRRDSLDPDFYDVYFKPMGAAKKKLEERRKLLAGVLDQVARVFDNSNLKGFHFPASCENDFYALVGAWLERGNFSDPQMKDHVQEIRDTLSEFRRLVALFVTARREGAEVDPNVSSSNVAKYGTTFLGGQQNSKARRVERREVLVEVLNDVALAPVADTFGATTRAIIWARSADKNCGRCGEIVAYEDYEAGHILPKAKGGTAHYTNGRVEHAKCNNQAGAD